eukprot:TRINITY_DN5363_c0_g1_i1.p1 TRINITY_DN5363_c0_g1~~TRINITY_DN5363_c0_g1_i1.p1  ORF type:complete len:477 (+),score=122.41 TRINITY_DN5363_c0_g1_i1:57-1433(+)
MEGFHRKRRLSPRSGSFHSDEPSSKRAALSEPECELEENDKKYSMFSVPFVPPRPSFLRCYVSSSNNGDLFFRCLQEESAFKWERSDEWDDAELIWKPSARGIDPSKLRKLRCFNHFPSHDVVSNKANLLRVVSDRFIPFTVDTPSPAEARRLVDWVAKKDEFQTVPHEEEEEHFPSMPPMSLSKVILSKGVLHRKTFGNTTWIVKPAFLFGGSDIRVCSTADDVERETKDMYQKGRVMKGCRYVLQKYIERPMLYGDKKFDVRVWVLCTNEGDLYYYEDLYARLASVPFDLHSTDEFVHLTNNVVQVKCDEYGCDRPGNQLSKDEFRHFLHTRGLSFTRSVVNPVVECAKDVFGRAWDAGLKRDAKRSFEVFGLDFMFDEDGVAWLLEVNTNPCLAESSPFVANALRNMLREVVRRWIDPMLAGNPFLAEKNTGGGDYDDRFERIASFEGGQKTYEK